MIEQFINFILETNIMASISLCFGFIVLSVGVLGPLINLIVNMAWSFIDETDFKEPTWFISKVLRGLSFLRPNIQWEVKEESHYSGNYHLWNGHCYRYRDSNTTQSMVDHDTAFRSKARAEKAALEDNTYIGGFGTYLLLLIGSVVGSVVLAVVFNYFLWPTVYVISCIGFMFALRILRRLQKKATELVTKFKEHTEKPSSEAHSPEE